jgi:hypothetical protein
MLHSTRQTAFQLHEASAVLVGFWWAAMGKVLFRKGVNSEDVTDDVPTNRS